MDNTHTTLLNKRPVAGRKINNPLSLALILSLQALGHFVISHGKRRAVDMRFLILALGLSASTFAYSAYNWSGTYYAGDGIVKSVAIGVKNVAETRTITGCPSNKLGAVLLSRNNYNWGSSGGYYGIVLAPDVILSLSGYANVSGTLNSGRFEVVKILQRFHFNADISYNGFVLISGGGNSGEALIKHINDGDAYLRLIHPRMEYKNNVRYISESSLSAQLYVGPNATPGTYNLDALRIEYMCGNTYNVLETSIITIKKRELSCSISSPTTIDFGTFDVKGHSDGEVLAVHKGNLNVTCSDQGVNSARGAISVTGESGRYTNTLKMDLAGTTAVAPAEIRGFIGPGIPQTGVCDGNTGYTGWINFTNPKQNISLGSLRTGNNTIPYNFSLCSTGGSNAGRASAKATISLSWD